MLIFNSLLEVQMYNLAIARHLESEIAADIEDNPDYPDGAIGTFNEYFGGFMMIPESLEDLKEFIVKREFNSEGDCKSYSILEKTARLDYFEIQTFGSETFVIAQMVTNDAGGNFFYIPSHIAFECPNLLFSIYMESL